MALVLLRLFLNPHKKKEKYTATNTNTFLTREAKRGENRCKFNRRKDRKAYVTTQNPERGGQIVTVITKI